MSQKIELPEEKLTKTTKISFSFGAFANNVLNGLVFGNITFFYNQKLGADATLLAIGWVIFAFWNTINDPIVSYFIDNTRTKIGRRIPYIRYGSFIYALAFVLCWIPIAPLDNQFALFLNFIFVSWNLVLGNSTRVLTNQYHKALEGFLKYYFQICVLFLL